MLTEASKSAEMRLEIERSKGIDADDVMIDGALLASAEGTDFVLTLSQRA